MNKHMGEQIKLPVHKNSKKFMQKPCPQGSEQQLALLKSVYCAYFPNVTICNPVK